MRGRETGTLSKDRCQLKALPIDFDKELVPSHVAKVKNILHAALSTLRNTGVLDFSRFLTGYQWFSCAETNRRCDEPRGYQRLYTLPAFPTDPYGDCTSGSGEKLSPLDHSTLV